MERQARIRIVDMVLGPPLLGLFFVAKVFYKILFSWWYDPWSQRKANDSLWNDVQSNFSFLTSKGHLVKERRIRIHPFDYASIRIILDNLCFRFTRGRGELNISLSPSRALEDSHHLDCVIAAIDTKDVMEIGPITSLYEAAQVVQSRLDALNKAFSESEYPEFRKKLSREKESERIRTRQLEWELNQRLYGNRITKS
jgi:hypothetical protein